jgi:hypothetical protein
MFKATKTTDQKIVQTQMSDITCFSFFWVNQTFQLFIQNMYLILLKCPIDKKLNDKITLSCIHL